MWLFEIRCFSYKPTEPTVAVEQPKFLFKNLIFIILEEHCLRIAYCSLFLETPIMSILNSVFVDACGVTEWTMVNH